MARPQPVPLRSEPSDAARLARGRRLAGWLVGPLVWLFVPASPPPAQAAEQLLVGPRQYTRTAGPPNQFSETIAVPPTVTAPFRLHVQNGNPDGTYRISSATLTLNGTPVAGPADFSQQVAGFERAVTLQASNTLQVRLTSAPGSFLVLTLSGTIPPPTLTKLEPPALPITQGGTGTLAATLSASQSEATTLSLQSEAPGVATVPSTTTVPANQLTVPISVIAVAPGTAHITATLNDSSVQSTITVAPAGPTLTSLLPGTLQVTQGAAGTLTVTISAAQATDTGVALSSSAPGVVGLPPIGSVAVPAGQTAQAFVVFGNSTGQATITAILNGATAASQVTVVLPLPTVVSLLPPTLPLTEGSQGTLTITLNASQPVDTDVFLSTSDPPVVGLPGDRVVVPADTLAASFAVTGLARGLATVTAALNGSTATAAITVQPPPPTVQALSCPATLTPGATGLCTVSLNATQLTDTTFPLVSADPAIVTVPASVIVPANTLTTQIVATGVTVGPTTVTAGPLNSTSRSAVIQVVPPPPTVVNLLPPTGILYVGATATFTLTLNAAQLTDTAVALTTIPTGILNAPALVTVPAGNLLVSVIVTGLTPGSATVTAGPLNGTQAASTLTVTQLPPTLTALSPATLSLPHGTAGTLTVTMAPTQPDPVVVPLTSSDGSVEVPPSVTVPAGSAAAEFPVLARAEGSALITAGPLNGTSQTVTVTVTPPALVTLLVTPPAPTIAQGQTQPFTAEGTYTDATTQDLTGEAAWSSADETVATITAVGGLATGHAAGETMITATVGSLTATATLTVTPPILASIAIRPTTPSVHLGQTLQLAAAGTLTDATPQDVTVQVTWTSSDPAVATITSPGGLATALTPGTTTLTATHPEGLTASTTLTVLLPPPTITTFEPQSLTIPLGSTGSLTATISAAQAGDTAITLTSSNPVVASVPLTASVPPGELTVAVPVAAGAPGTATITATLNTSSLQSTVTVSPAGPTLTSLLPATLWGAPGASATFTVTLSAAQDTDTLVTLTSSDPGIVGLPATGTVTVPAGQHSQAFTVGGTNSGMATITATLNGSTVQGQVTVTPVPPAVVSLLPPVLTVAEWGSGTLTVTLNASQPTDTEVLLTSSHPWWLGLPGDRVTVPANTPAASFTVTGNAASTETVTASLNGSSVTTAVSIKPFYLLPTLQALTCPATLTVGATGQCSLTLHAPQATDTEVPLTGTAPGVLTVPGSVIIPANTLAGTFAVTGVAPGSADITGGPLTGTTQQASVQVVPPPPTLVSLLPTPAALAVGAMTTLTVTLNAIQPTNTPIPLTSGAPGIVTVPPTVTVPAGSLTAPVPLTGLTPGTVTLSVGPLNGSQSQSTVTVNQLLPTITAVTPADVTTFWYRAVPLTVSLSAAQPEATVFALASSDPNTVQVPPTVTVPAGSATAEFPILTREPGTAIVTVGPLHGTSAQATITVNAVALVSFTVSPAAATLGVGQRQQFRAIGTSTDGTIEDDTWLVTWRSSATAVARIDEWGLATALAPGTTTITATLYDGSTATSTLTVTPPPLTSLTLTPLTPTRGVGEQVQFQATGTHTDGTTRDVTSEVAWTSSNPTVATIASPGGIATALAPGTTIITATMEGRTATATLTVIRRVLSRLTLMPLTPTRAVGDQVRFQANGTHADGSTQDLTSVVAWTSSNPAVATIASPGGIATALAPGTTDITAAHPEGLTSTTALTVLLLIPPTIAITEPADGTTISRDRVLVRGTIEAGGAEVGVVVNGIPAALQGTTFAALVAVTPETTSLTAVATSILGATATSSISVTVIPTPPPPVTLEVFPAGGPSPLRVTFRLQNNTGRPLVSFELDLDGDGSVDLTSATFENPQATYNGQGLFLAKLRATDDQGQVYTAETLVSVGAAPALEPKWEGMKDALRRGDIPASLAFIHSTTRARYEATFRRLTPAQLAIIDQYLTTIVPVEIGPTGAEYELRRTRDGQTLSYAVWFQVDADGIWRLRLF